MFGIYKRTVLQMASDCGGKSYDPRVAACCEGTLHADVTPFDECCGEETYNNRNYICCDGEIFSKNDRKDCNTSIFTRGLTLQSNL